MPFAVNREPRGICFRFQGVCTGDDVRRVFEMLSGSPDVDVMHFALFDYSQVSELSATKSQIEDALVLDIGLSSYSPHLKVVTIANEPYLAAIWSHLVSVHTQKDRHALFSCEVLARKWLERFN